jgi:hypothetical protein
MSPHAPLIDRVQTGARRDPRLVKTVPANLPTAAPREA